MPGGGNTSSGHLQKRVGKYLLGRTIGEGTYAKVKYGQHAETGEAVAVKVLDKEALVRSGMVEQIKREITILKQIRHPHIVNLLEVMSSRDKIFMVLELVTGGELFDKIVAEGPMKESLARRVFSQLLDAVGHCHSQGVYHRDLKPENVLLSSNGVVKLSDFGLGVLPHPSGMDGLLRTTCGTPNYVAPEVLAKKGYQGGPADIWSLGVVLYVILSGCLPFDEDDLVTLFHKISAAQYEVPPWLSHEAVALLAAMLQPAPEQRATIEQIWQHPWLRGGLARRSVVPGVNVLVPAHSGSTEQRLDQDPFAETVQPEMVQKAYASDSKRRVLALQMSPGSLRRVNAFEMLASGLDISALFEARDDVVTRRTRFSCRASVSTIMDSIESATVAVGGRVARQDGGRLRLYIPNPRGTIHVLAELFEVVPGTHMVDLQKVQGDTAKFHKWYADLTHALSSIITKRQPGVGELGSRGAPARRAAGIAGGQLRANAFELIARSFNIGAMFEDPHATSQHVQFSSRRPPGEILAALEAAAVGMGGSAQIRGEKRAVLTVPVGSGRAVRMEAHLFEVLAGVHVCQIEKAAGGGMDFMRIYAQLASKVQPIMLKSTAHPTARHASQLLTPTPSMGEQERAAIEQLLLHRSSSATSDGGASASSGSQSLGLETRFEAATLGSRSQGEEAARRGPMKLDDGVVQAFSLGRVFKNTPQPGDDATARINSLSFHRTEDKLVTASDDDAIRLYDTQTGAESKTLLSKKYGCANISFTHDPFSVIASSNKGSDYALRYHDLHANRFLRYFRGHTGRVTTLAMSPRSDVFLSAAEDKQVRLWDLRVNGCQALLQTPGLPTTAFDEQGLVFAVGAERGVVKLYDARNWGAGPFTSFPVQDEINSGALFGCLKFSLDGSMLLAVAEGRIYVLDSFEGKVMQKIVNPGVGEGGQALEACLTPDAHYVLSGNPDCTIRAWSVATGEQAAQWKGHAGVPACLKFSPRKLLVASACSALGFWIPDTARVLQLQAAQRAATPMQPQQAPPPQQQQQQQYSQPPQYQQQQQPQQQHI
ncbi:CBL-interacting kinase 32 [Micractinium conductrix]|uniref:non-specific serine/threonine protein kinase n=1 Tax=Micractinium conductrix TaxID=554055 RepID=A0A2P6VC10_9CHLO|nr:CBL-interacting kinase 32 [Micractinium conductrix]|eukprot:PSC71591.1 CBL-interacting kinase 32 [Micractinium conductrix]